MAMTMESTVVKKSKLLDLILTVWLDWTIPVGRIWGIPIDIHFLSVIGMFFWFNVLKGDDFDLQRIYMLSIKFLILSCSLVVHELMHAVVAKYFKKKVEGMRFILPNIAMVFVDIHPRRPSRDIWIYLAGPMSNLIISGLVFFIAYCGGRQITWTTRQIIEYAFDINLAIAVFNMIPFYPLDGGRFFRDLLLILKIPERYANIIALGIACLCFSGLVYLSLTEKAYGLLIIVSLLMTASVLSLTGVLNLEEQTT